MGKSVKVVRVRPTGATTPLGDAVVGEEAEELAKMDNVVVTPHSAFYSDAAFKRMRVTVGQEAARVASGKWPEVVVNETVKTRFSYVKGD